MLGRCVLRPAAVSGGDACEKAEDGCAIRGALRSALTHAFTITSSSYVSSLLTKDPSENLSVHELSCLQLCDMYPDNT